RKAKLKARVPTFAANFVNNSHEGQFGKFRGLRKQIGKDAIKVAANTIGITPTALRSEVEGGKSIADVAVEHGKTGQDVIDALVSAADAKINASTKLTTAQKTKLEAKVPDAAAKFVNSWHPKR